MAILYIDNIISKSNSKVKMSSTREMAPVYNLGCSSEKWIDKRFSKTTIAFHVDDNKLLKPVGDKYNLAYAGRYIFKNVNVSKIEQIDNNNYLVTLEAEKLAVVILDFEIENK